MIAELLNNNAQDNMAGVKRTLYFALAADVDTWPAITSPATTYEELVTYTSGFTMSSTKQFFKFQATVRKSSLNFESAGERGSKSSVNRLEVMRATLDKKIFGFLEAHKNDEMIWIVEDLNGDVRVLGEEDLPAMMEEFSGGTGADVADAKEVRFVIESVGNLPKFYNDQTIPLTPAV